MYSIASSNEYLSKSAGGNITVRLDLLLSVVEYQTLTGRKFGGFCSNFLANILVGEKVAMYLKSNPGFHFNPLVEGKLPTLLIGAGSGMAPFRGFWQTLGNQNMVSGPSHFYSHDK